MILTQIWEGQWGDGSRTRRPARVPDFLAVLVALPVHPGSVPGGRQAARALASRRRLQACDGLQVQGGQHADGLHADNQGGRDVAAPGVGGGSTPAVEVAGLHEPLAFGGCLSRRVRVHGGAELWRPLVAPGVHSLRGLGRLLAYAESGEVSVSTRL